ncbi:MAG: cytidine deaminase [Eubacteriales bacterium]|nr:cytidine deaminase [Eubacteriales bacterium]
MYAFFNKIMLNEETIKNLINEAIIGRKNSYSPYSHYKVGAALLLENNEIITGCNIENAQYSLGVCAERVALQKAISKGEKSFLAIAIVGGREDEENEFSDYAFPCGACRQVMREFVNKNIFKIIVAKSINEYKIFTLEELLPFSFGKENL